MTILGTPRAPDERSDQRSAEESGDRKFEQVFETDPLPLDLGGSLGPITVAYESWGTPSPARNNAILIEHALTGDSHAAGDVGPGHPTPGWWDSLIGPGAAIDTDHWWVICPNTLGGCRGTTGPGSPSPDGAPWGSRFPTVTVRDQVAVEAALTDVLGVDRWAAIVGGSMGGMRALEWAVMYPDRVERLIVLACGAAATAEQIALCAVQSEAIRLDPDFHGGDYYSVPPGQGPERGLSLARRLGHVTYRSELELNDRFGRTRSLARIPSRAAAMPLRATWTIRPRNSYDDSTPTATSFSAAPWITMTSAVTAVERRPHWRLSVPPPQWSGWTRTGSTHCDSNSNWRPCCRVDRK